VTAVDEQIKLTIRDGRVGRDPSLVGADGLGEVLAVRYVDVPVTEGDLLTLDNGDVVQIIGRSDTIGTDGTWEIVAFIGNT
jgi:hypothetical protein